jgi:hypothetical protein
MMRRQKELKRADQAREKEERREQRKREKLLNQATRKQGDVDPDIAGIVPGPQPPAE